MLRALQLVLRDKSRFASSGFINGFSTAPNPQRLAGKVAVITGAASGIGKATAAEFVRNGAKVVLADVQDDLGRSVAAELGPGAAYTRCDVSDEVQIAAAVDLAVERHGRLDILYSNAGVSGSASQASVGALDLADFDRVMAVNARSAVACIKHGARVMAPGRRGGCVLCTASVIGVLSFGSPILAYAVSKATVIAAVRAAAGPLARDRVRVNAISPHAIATPLTVRSMAEIFPGAGEDALRRVVEEDWSELGGTVLQVEEKKSSKSDIRFLEVHGERLSSRLMTSTDLKVALVATSALWNFSDAMQTRQTNSVSPPPSSALPSPPPRSPSPLHPPREVREGRNPWRRVATVRRFLQGVMATGELVGETVRKEEKTYPALLRRTE